ncbi:hypothetical protein KC571_00200 [candidate division WWE3 bacterium]|uniref:DUF5659 domain-containing protein n=1 Tax=candidate division WWE3 bacterium TaxID=2053526 RepID=A0A955LGI6_UNCKA|nr:hypothetical protein [candidate division WWE3 bacterium]
MNQNDYYKNNFSTYDLGLASALVTAGYTVNHLDRSDSKKVQFIFNHEEQLDDVIQAYWAHKLKLSPLAYFNNVKMLKNRIYSN